jgi:Family of unknown function (DUF5681)
MSNRSSKSGRIADQSASLDVAPTARVEICDPSAAKEENADSSMAAPYSVGYGRPPKNTQFKKGRSGNPKGRPKGRRNLSSELRKLFTDPVIVHVRGKQRRVAAILALQHVQLNRALKGDHRAALAVFKNAKEFGVLDQAEMDVSTHTNYLTDETLDRLSGEALAELIRVEQDILSQKESRKKTR